MQTSKRLIKKASLVARIVKWARVELAHACIIHPTRAHRALVLSNPYIVRVLHCTLHHRICDPFSGLTRPSLGYPVHTCTMALARLVTGWLGLLPTETYVVTMVLFGAWGPTTQPCSLWSGIPSSPHDYQNGLRIRGGGLSPLSLALRFNYAFTIE